jgi:hypothetical protein
VSPNHAPHTYSFVVVPPWHNTNACHILRSSYDKKILIRCLLHADGPSTSGNTIAFKCAVYFAVKVTVADG